MLFIFALLLSLAGSKMISGVSQIPAIDEVVLKEMDRLHLAGVAVGIADQGEIVYTQGYGYADLSTNTPVKANGTMFRWASIAKTVTAVIALRLWEMGLLDFDRDIQDYYPTPGWPSTLYVNGTTQDLPVNQRVITMRMLMAHLAGIPHWDNDGLPAPNPPETFINDPAVNNGIRWAVDMSVVGTPLIRTPGDRQYFYTTFGFTLAGVVEEIISGRTFGELVRNLVAIPARIPFLEEDNEFSPVPNRAVGYTWENGAFRPEGSTDVSYRSPGGGLISTVEDLLIYGNAIHLRQLLSPASMQLVHTPQEGSSRGIGFEVGERNGIGYIGHGGTQQKTKTHLRMYNDSLVIAVMCNSQELNPTSLLQLVEDAYRASRTFH